MDVLELLVPRPRRVTWTGGVRASDSVGQPRGIERVDAALGDVIAAGESAGIRAQASRLEIPADAGAPIVISGASDAGIRYAHATLAQVLKAAKVQPGCGIRACVVDDAPRFATRGVMLDVSRNKVPTMASLRETIDLLASLKYNHLQLYTEHTFAYAGHEDAWRGWSPLTPEEVRELDRYARARGIELAANQNCFGHLAQWLRLPRYAHLAETHDLWQFLKWTRKGPFSLCPVDPGSIELVRDLLTQLAPCFESPLMNIGCDETFDVGCGRSKDEVLRRGGGDAHRGRGEVFFDFVEQICGVVRGLGKRPALWADIALEHPELLHRFPRDAVALAWGYEPDAAFERWCRLLVERGIETWVCPGTSSWRSITGRTHESRWNMHAAAAQGLASGATGYLLTDWGDCGHHQQWPITMNALAHGAELAWNGPGDDGGSRPGASPHAVALQVLGDSAWATPTNAAAWLDELGDADLHVRRASGVRNATGFFNDLYPPAQIPPRPPAPEHLEIKVSREEFARAGETLARLESTRPAASRFVDARIGDELAFTMRYALLAVRHALSARGSPAFAADEVRELHAGFAEIAREHARLWVRRTREGGLTASQAHFDKLIALLEARMRS
jgi:hypothetical protein